MLRHSKREEPEELHQLIDAALTDEGRDGARRFGESLPRDRIYRFYHSPVERCAETAQIVASALPEGRSLGVEEAGFLFRIHAEKESFRRFLARDGDNIINHWLAGHYPEGDIEPPISFARAVQQEWRSIQERHRSAGEEHVTTVFLSHDLHTAVCLYLWTGLFRGSEDMIQPMDGFLLEEHADGLSVLTKEGVKELSGPHWWNATDRGPVGGIDRPGESG